jgi:hypothetical protein
MSAPGATIRPCQVTSNRCPRVLLAAPGAVPAVLAGEYWAGAGGAAGDRRAGEREQVLVSAWLTGLRSARTRRACAGDVAGLGRELALARGFVSLARQMPRPP